MDKGIAGEERSSSPGKDWQNEDRLVDILHRLLGQADVNHGLTQVCCLFACVCGGGGGGISVVHSLHIIHCRL